MEDNNCESHFQYQRGGSDNLTSPVQEDNRTMNHASIPTYPHYFAGFPNPSTSGQHMDVENPSYREEIPRNTSSSFDNGNKFCGVNQSEQYSYNNSSYNQSEMDSVSPHINDYRQYQSYATYSSGLNNQLPPQYSNHSNQLSSHHGNHSNQLSSHHGNHSNQFPQSCDQSSPATFQNSTETCSEYIQSDTNSQMNMLPAYSDGMIPAQQTLTQDLYQQQSSDLTYETTDSARHNTGNAYESRVESYTNDSKGIDHEQPSSDLNYEIANTTHGYANNSNRNSAESYTNDSKARDDEQPVIIAETASQTNIHTLALNQPSRDKEAQPMEHVSQNELYCALESSNPDISNLAHPSRAEPTQRVTHAEIVNEIKAHMMPLGNTLVGKDSNENQEMHHSMNTDHTEAKATTYHLDSNIPKEELDKIDMTNNDSTILKIDNEDMNIGKAVCTSVATEKNEFDKYPNIKSAENTKVTSEKFHVSVEKPVNNTSNENSCSESTSPTESRFPVQDTEPDSHDMMSIIMKRRLGGAENLRATSAVKRRKLINKIEDEDNMIEHCDNDHDDERKIVRSIPAEEPLNTSEIKYDSEKVETSPEPTTAPIQPVGNLKATIDIHIPDADDSNSGASHDNGFFLSCFKSLQDPDSDEDTGTSDVDLETSKMAETERSKIAEGLAIITVNTKHNSSDRESESSKIAECYPTNGENTDCPGVESGNPKHAEAVRCPIVALKTVEPVSSVAESISSKITENHQTSLVDTEAVHSDSNEKDKPVKTDPDHSLTAADSKKLSIKKTDILEKTSDLKLLKTDSENSKLELCVKRNKNLVTDTEINSNERSVGHLSEHSQSSDLSGVAPPSERVQTSSRRTIESILSSVRPVATDNDESVDEDKQCQSTEGESCDESLSSTVDKSSGKLLVKIFKRKATDHDELSTSSEHKKSRKQHMPKRVYRSFPVPSNYCSTEVSAVSQAGSGEESLVPHIANKANIWLETIILLKTKSEKPKKQIIPKRFLDSEIAEHKLSMVGHKSAAGNSGKKSKSETKRKQNIPKRFRDFLETKDELDNYINRTPSKRIPGEIDGSFSGEMEPHYSKYFELNRAMELIGGVDDSTDPHSELIDFGPGETDLKIPPLPVQGGVVENLMKSVHQGTPSDADTSGSKTNFDANLDIVRKLREIRFNRYRKISISEKKIIAAYAKIHGVSTAANHHGVSKSAVSLWTRTEFKESDEDLERRRRNCMLGNEKFETLIKRVKGEKYRKFKGLNKEDKYEVSKYAKLVGVREMSRCLDIALGTVSGWMRQYPYVITPANEEDVEITANQIGLDMSCDGEVGGAMGVEKSEIALIKPENIKKEVNDVDDIKVKEDESKISLKQEHSKVTEKYGLLQFSALNPDENVETKNLTVNVKTEPGLEIAEKSAEQLQQNIKGDVGTEVTPEMAVNSGTGANIEDIRKGKDAPDLKNVEKEVEKLIAQSHVPPDVDKCWQDIKYQITDTILENDTFFESLFRRLTMCRVDKYKTLKASEKLEIVRYAKRVGVRKIAKIMDLATGTLSGWINRYQSHLGLTMSEGTDSDKSILNMSDSGLNQSMDNSVDLGQNSASVSESFSNSSLASTPNLLSRSSSILDDEEKGEVTALRFLLKDQFSVLSDKITIAKTMKFRNMTPADKIEIVKCAKLVGIRPTARVLSMPIGTLSGWITKYSRILEPEFQGNGQGGGMMIDMPVNNESEATSVVNPEEHSLHSNEDEATSSSSEDTESAPSAYSQMMDEYARSSQRESTEDQEPTKQVPLRRARISWPKMDSLGGTDDADLTQFLPSVKLPNGYESSILNSSFNVATQPSESQDFNQPSPYSSQTTRMEEAFAQQYIQNAYQQQGGYPRVAFSQ